ncbi:hypothetical protein AM500_05145 [Bacillus sp. FJAT-18017]|uniref:tetratricopeptide repeat protein n=1 Tax=Bacillus sp. FJAT-18017 TaxID=1705566 RepID=UPI0006AE6431|nr:hypothetical protein [Bacillus sp. FJAT-18017]ALC89236.1 hypothetical protein AM500_05145 [Bacillus sp. FJAT-18017]
MDEKLTNYNQAISLIHEGRLGDAESLLNRLTTAGFTIALWPLGLIKAATGRPFEALSHWETVSPSSVPQVTVKRETLIQTLPEYKKIFELYNAAIEKARIDGAAPRHEVFSELLSKGDKIPLPAELYKACFLSLLLEGKNGKFKSEYEKAPDYIRENPDIKTISLRAEQAGHEEWKKRSESKAIRYKRLAGASFAAVFLALALTGGIASGIFSKQEKSEPVSSAEVAKTKIQDDRVKALEEELEQLMSVNSNLEEDLKQKETALKETEATQALLEAAGINIGQLSSEAAERMYREGLALYQDGEFIEASELLKKSLSFSSTNYFSDDAHFYLITSGLKSGNGMEDELTSFLAESKEAYRQSPYLDDVMLLMAESYLNSGDKAAAESLLKKIQSDFSLEWTANKAKELRNR